MQDRGYRLRRIPLPRNPVNKPLVEHIEAVLSLGPHY
jgi:hypothetical protein